MRPLRAVPAAASRFVPHARLLLGPEEQSAALRVLRSGRLAPGAEAARLETLVTRMAGGTSAVALSSGTLALTLALRALGVEERDEVAIPAYTCAAVLHAVRAAGARPLVCDVDPATLALDAEDMRRRATALRAVVLVHPFGWPAPADDYRAGGAALVEDCAQSPGARLRGAPTGSWGDAAVYSFAPTKLVTCGGPGGALAAPQPRLVARARDMARHDENDDDAPHLNGLMGDLHAAIACSQIERIASLVARRRALAARYDAAFADFPWTRPAAPPAAEPVFSRYLLRVKEGSTSIIDKLQIAGVMARRPVYRPLHQILPGAGRCPGADAAHAEWLSLPLSPAFDDAEIDKVVQAVRACRS